MMGLAPALGRGEAHHVVHRACDVALDQGIPLADALLREPSVAAKLDRAAIERMTDPAGYLGAAGAFVDRVLARVG
jgi:3-carboxy-cis,cis-muconate cycloisomerase